MRLQTCWLVPVLALGSIGCIDSSRCDAALAGIERTRLDTQQRDAQLAWLRLELAAFAAQLQARNAADRDLLLQRLVTLQAENAALAQRIDRAQLQAPPEPSLPPPGGGLPAPAPPQRAAHPPGRTAPLPVGERRRALPAPIPPADPPRPPPVTPALLVPPVPAPPVRPPRQIETKLEKARGIDEASPY